MLKINKSEMKKSILVIKFMGSVLYGYVPEEFLDFTQGIRTLVNYEFKGSVPSLWYGIKFLRYGTLKI